MQEKDADAFCDTSIRKRSITVAGHKTSITIEESFWRVIQWEAGERNISVSHLVALIASSYSGKNLSSALRQFALGVVLRRAPPPLSNLINTRLLICI